jgi:hypothetical protein
VGKPVVVVTFLGNQKHLNVAIDGVKSKMGGLKKAALFVGPPLLVAAGAIGAELVRATKGFQDHQKVVKETGTRIAEMGNAAHTTVKHVSDLSDAIEAKTAVDGDQVQSGANMLLTFGNIRNEVGKGKDIFDQATLAATEMAAKFGGDASSQAIVLGKALDNPTKGLSALTRIGVTFSEKEKEQIKTMQEHGDIAGAQGLILQAVNHQVAGAAEAQATSWDHLMVKIHGIEDNIGAFLLPIFDKVVSFITNKIIPALEKWWKDHGPQVIGSIRNFGHSLENARHALGNAGHAINNAIHAGSNFIHAMANVFHALGNVIHAVGNIVHAFGNFFHAIGNVFHALGNVGHALGNVERAISGTVSRVVTFVSKIPGKITTAIGDLGKLLYNAGKAVVQGLIDGIKAMVGAVGTAIGGVASKIRGFLPFSPAKEGPLSGSGSPFIAGQNITRMLNQGMLSGRRATGASMGSLLAPVAAGGRGGPAITIHARTNADAAEIAREVAWAMRTSGR